MSFNERAKTIALAIVHIFETAKPLGDYGVVAVLTDGAGFSVGINQFTHKSGSLAAVLDRFAKLGGNLPQVILDAMPDFRAGRNIAVRSGSGPLKNAIKALGPDELWHRAQREIAFEKYLGPAIDACDGSGFALPLSLAVVYDSINQGGYASVRDRVSAASSNEKAWIAEYCADRKTWLKGSKKPIVRTTVYRPNFFLGQIANGNWNLELPLNVNGYNLTDAKLFGNSAASDSTSPGTSTGEQGQSSATGASDDPADTQAADKPNGDAPPTMAEQAMAGSTDEKPPVPVQSVAAELTEDAKPTGIKGMIAAVVAFITSLGTGFFSLFQGLGPVITIGFFASAVLIATGFMYFRYKTNKDNLDRKAAQDEKDKQRAHEMQMAMIEAARNKNMNTIALIPPPVTTGAEVTPGAT